MSKYAQIRPEMWLDDEWRDMTLPGQWLYMHLLSHPQRSHAGVVDWRPKHVAQTARELSLLQVMQAAQEASDKHFLVFDQDTEEVLVRSFIRHDGILKQPRMCVSVANAWGAVGSNKIRAVLVHELLRLRKELPELEGWEKPQMKTVLRQTAANAKEMDTGLELPYGVDLPIGLGVALGQTQTGVSGSPTPFTSTLHHPPAPSSEEDAVRDGSSYPHPVTEVDVPGSVKASRRAAS